MMDGAMRRFGVPDHHRGPLRQFIRDDEVQFELLRKALLAAPATLQRERLASSVSAVLGRDVFDIVIMLCAMSAVWDDAMPRDRFVDEIVGAMQDLDQDALAGDLAQRARLRLEQVLLIDSIGVAGKGASVASDHERLFCHGRILTDIRPVFRRDLSTPPAGAILSHVLRISFHEEDLTKTKEFYVGLSSGSLRELRDLLDRAAEKEKNLRRQLDESKIPYLEIDDLHG